MPGGPPEIRGAFFPESCRADAVFPYICSGNLRMTGDHPEKWERAKYLIGLHAHHGKSP